MSKLNKIFLAVIIALLVTAVAEVIFIFVYKPIQTISVPTALQTLPSSTPLASPAINPKFLSGLGKMTKLQNETLTLTTQFTGTISSIIIDPTNINSYLTIRLNTGIVYGYNTNEFNNELKFYKIVSGTEIPIKVSDLSKGDNIMIQNSYNLALPPTNPAIAESIIKL